MSLSQIETVRLWGVLLIVVLAIASVVLFPDNGAMNVTLWPFVMFLFFTVTTVLGLKEDRRG